MIVRSIARCARGLNPGSNTTRPTAPSASASSQVATRSGFRLPSIRPYATPRLISATMRPFTCASFAANNAATSGLRVASAAVSTQMRA